MSRVGSLRVLIWVSLLWAMPVSCSLQAARDTLVSYSAISVTQFE